LRPECAIYEPRRDRGSLPRLRGTADFLAQPFVPLHRTDDEFAAELSNRTIHAVMHLAWAEQASGYDQGQMAVYVRPRGRLGSAYKAFIKPLRYLVVCPALMRYIERALNRRVPAAVGAAACPPTTHRGVIPVSDAVAAPPRIATWRRRSVHPNRHRRSVGARALPRPRPRRCVRPRDPHK
jgi:hypothetical protein